MDFGKKSSKIVYFYVNLFSLGKPRGAILPAPARFPTQSASSDSMRRLPAGSNQDRPSIKLKVVASFKPPSLYFASEHPYHET